MEEKLELKSGSIYMKVIANINKPKKFKAIPISTIKLVHHPEYKYNSFVEKELMWRMKNLENKKWLWNDNKYVL